MDLLEVQNPDVELIQLKWDTGMLNKLIGYALKKSKTITSTQLRNLQKLLSTCDYSNYRNRPIIMERVKFILNILEARLEKNYEDPDIIIQSCIPDTENVVIEEILKNLGRYRSLNYSEIEYLGKFIEDRLYHGIFINKTIQMKQIIEKIEDGDYSTFSQAHDMVLNWIRDYQVTRRLVRTSRNEDMLDFNDPDIENQVSEITKRLGDKSSIIVTGIQMLNEMLSPGFRPGKLYMFLGLSGGYKSAMLLKIVLDCVKYNASSYKPKTEGAKPYILYLTMENTIDESFARVWNMAIENTDVETNKPSDIVKRLKKERIVANDEMGILFAYRPNMSITTADLRDMIDEIQSTGKEVIMLSFDYIKRIMPQQRARDEKEMLKNVTNELRQLAIDFQIPVVSAHQFNRNGLAVVNNAMRDGKADLAKFLGGENIGSAYEVMENPDMVIVLNLEKKIDTQELYLTFYRIKERYRPSTKLNYFNQPFTIGNDFMLMDDILLDRPLGIESLSTEMQGAPADKLFGNRGRTNYKNTLLDDGMQTDDTFDLEPLS